MKKQNRPRVKHKEFGPMSFRLSGDDWLLALWNEANRQATYFLAEPIFGEGSEKSKIIGYWVSALERAGESQSTLRGLPRKFKTPDAAVEWLEERALPGYEGDTFGSPPVDPAANTEPAPALPPDSIFARVDKACDTFLEQINQTGETT